MISIKKFLESGVEVLRPHESNWRELLEAAVRSYRASLLHMGRSGSTACPATGAALKRDLEGLEKRLAGRLTTVVLQETGRDVTKQLVLWGERTAEHLKAKTQEVKDLLLVLAGTAESLGERDQRYASHLHQFTSKLRTVADLDDLTQVRSSLIQTAGELKSYVEQMELDSRQAIEQLQVRVTTYEAKLKETEELALRDALTGLPNRLFLEGYMESRIASGQPFCVAFLDLNHFKQVNDKYGHKIGDELLKQFAGELRSNTRPGDSVGRWSGDEFVIVMECDLAGATAMIDRMRKWVFGHYSLSVGGDGTKTRIRVDAAIGIAEWRPGETATDIAARADEAMYAEKKVCKIAEPAAQPA